MRRVRADGEIKLQYRLVVRPFCQGIRLVVGELQSYAGELARVVLKAGRLAPGLAPKSLLHVRQLEGIGKDVQHVIPCADPPSVFSVNSLDIEPVLFAPQLEIDDRRSAGSVV